MSERITVPRGLAPEIARALQPLYDAVSRLDGGVSIERPPLSFVQAPSSGGGGGGSTTLDGLTDVTISGVLEGDFLYYNAGLWKNTAGALSLISGNLNLPNQKLIQFATSSGNVAFIGSYDTDLRMRIGSNSFYIKNNADDATYFYIKNSNGNVGIGTTDPGAKLDVQGENPEIWIRSKTGRDSYAIRNVNTDSLTSDLRISWGDGLSTPTTDYITIHDNGNVGIGTTDPQTLLNLESTVPGAVPSIRIGGVHGSQYAPIGGIEFYETYYNDQVVARIRGNRGLTAQHGEITFEVTEGGTGFNEAMRIVASGKVGIGTTDPQTKLDVRGDGQFITSGSGNIQVAIGRENSSQLHLAYVGASYWPQIRSTSTSYLWIEGTVLDLATGTNESSRTSRLRISETGYVGIRCEPVESTALTVNGTIGSSQGAISSYTATAGNSAWIAVSNPGRWWTIKVDGSDGDKWKLRDDTAPADRITVDQNGTVSINGSCYILNRFSTLQNVADSSNAQTDQSLLSDDSIRIYGYGNRAQGWGAGITFYNSASTSSPSSFWAMARIIAGATNSSNAQANSDMLLQTREYVGGWVFRTVLALFSSQNAAFYGRLDVTSILTGTDYAHFTSTGNVSGYFRSTGIVDSGQASLFEWHGSRQGTPTVYTRWGGFFGDYVSGVGIFSDSRPLFLRTVGAHSIQLQPNSTTQVTIDATGLGVKVTPSVELDVVGKMRAMRGSTDTILFNGTDGLELGNVSATNNNYIALTFVDSTYTIAAGIATRFTDHVNHYANIYFGTRGSGGWKSDVLALLSTGEVRTACDLYVGAETVGAGQRYLRIVPEAANQAGIIWYDGATAKYGHFKSSGNALYLYDYAASKTLWTQISDTCFYNDTFAIQSATYNSSYFGYGWKLVRDGTTYESSLVIDNITVRGTLKAHVFQKDIVRATNGYLFISDCSEILCDSPMDTGGDSYIWVKENVFRVGDLLWYSELDESSGTVKKIQMTVLSEDGWQPLPQGNKSGYEYLVAPNNNETARVGATVVRIGSTVAGRKGSVYFDSSSTDAPYMEIYDDVDSWTSFKTAAKVKVRLGKLDGLTMEGQGMTGYGLYLASGIGSNSLQLSADKTTALLVMKQNNNTVFSFNTANQTAYIAGWQFDNRYFWKLSTGTPSGSGYGGLVIDSTDRSLTIFGNTANSRYVKMYYTDASNWGIKGTDSTGAVVFQLGNTNQIAGWSFTSALFQDGGQYINLDSSNKTILVNPDPGNTYDHISVGQVMETDGSYNGAYGINYVNSDVQTEYFRLTPGLSHIANWTFTDYYIQKSFDSGTRNLNLNTNCNNSGVPAIYYWDVSPASGEVRWLGFGLLHDGTNWTNSGTSEYGIGMVVYNGSTYDKIFWLSQSTKQIAGWNFDSRYFWKLGSGTPGSSPYKGVVLDSTGTEVIVYGNTSNARFTKMYYTSDTDWGIKGTDSAGTTTFQLGYVNSIAGWTFTDTKFYSGTGSNYVGIMKYVSAGTDIAFFAGASDSSGTSAVFKVLCSGAVTMTNATIQTAASGTRIEIGGNTYENNIKFYYSTNEIARFLSTGSGVFLLQIRENGGYFKVENTNSSRTYLQAEDDQVRLYGQIASSGPANHYSPGSGSPGAFYIRNGYFCIVYYDLGTVRYKYLQLSGTGTTWVHATTGP